MTLDDLIKPIYCDKCTVARATHLIKLLDGELAFCGHHYNQHKEALDKKAYEIVDLDKKETPLIEKEIING